MDRLHTERKNEEEAVYDSVNHDRNGDGLRPHELKDETGRFSPRPLPLGRVSAVFCGGTHEAMTQMRVRTPAAMMAPVESDLPRHSDWSAPATARVTSAQKPVKALRPSTARLTVRDISASEYLSGEIVYISRREEEKRVSDFDGGKNKS